MQPNTNTPSHKIWNSSNKLSKRVKELRDEFFSFRERDYFRNEVMAFTTGKPWDTVWSPHNWGVVPEIYPFFEAFQDTLLVSAEEVSLAENFWLEPLVVRRAMFFKTVLESYLPVKILTGELIVGSNFNTALSRTHTKEESEKFKEMERKWLNDAKMINELGLGNCGAIPCHLIPNYPKILNSGFKSVKFEIEKVIGEKSPATKSEIHNPESTVHNGKPPVKVEINNKNTLLMPSSHITEEESEIIHFVAQKLSDNNSEIYNNHIDLLRALIICCDAVKNFAERYAAEAENLANSTDNFERKKELIEISRICKKAPFEKAESFHEALQSLWFTHSLVMVAESYPGAGLSFGRLDQYLYPFYKQDIESGKLTREKAKELLECFFIKPNYAYDYQGRIGTNQGINSGFGQLMTLSGMGANGEDLTNDLTYLILEAFEELNLLEPKPNVRIHKNTPQKFLLRVCEMLASSQGSPFLINFDEASIKGLRWEGLPEDALWNYAPVGCLENTLQGNDRSGTVDVNINLVKPVELVFGRGRDLKTKKLLSPQTKPAEEMENFEEFYTAYKIHLESEIEILLKCTNLADAIRAEFEPTPYLSLLVEGCIKNAKDITQGGAEHNYITVEGIAFANTVDSLAAVKKLVFEDNRIPMIDLVSAIKNNFEGQKYEQIRQILLNKSPKYGNDDDYADTIARKLSRFWNKRVFEFHTPATGKRYRAGYLSWNYWVSYAPSTAATPDGRKRGMYLSNGICPVNGMDQKGPTAVCNSISKLGLETAPNGTSHTISLSPSLIRDKEHLEKLVAFLRNYTAHGGTALQINMVDAETLKRAQDNPEEYQNLLVRITGYNAYFVMLGKEIQDEIIARAVHT